MYYALILFYLFTDDANFLGGEGSPNWELLAPKGNRFFLPGSLGPAWQGANTTVTLDTTLENLVDFSSKDKCKLHISSQECPMLLRKNLHELFPAPEVVANANLTMITLSSQLGYESELGAKNVSLFFSHTNYTRVNDVLFIYFIVFAKTYFISS